MTVLLLDTNIVSILFNRNHALRSKCIEAVAGRQLVMSLMTRAELLLWPAANNWGMQRREPLGQRMDAYLTLYADERTCSMRVDIVSQWRHRGQPMQTTDAWIAASARQWACPIVTTEFFARFLRAAGNRSFGYFAIRVPA